MHRYWNPHGEVIFVPRNRYRILGYDKLLRDLGLVNNTARFIQYADAANEGAAEGWNEFTYSFRHLPETLY